MYINKFDHFMYNINLKFDMSQYEEFIEIMMKMILWFEFENDDEIVNRWKYLTGQMLIK